MSRLAFLSATALTATLAVAPAPASVDTSLCVGTGTMTFSPPLGLANIAGTFTFHVVCLEGGTLSGTGAFFGSCVAATGTGGNFTMVSVGSEYVFTGGMTGVAHLVPSTVAGCTSLRGGSQRTGPWIVCAGDESTTACV